MTIKLSQDDLPLALTAQKEWRFRKADKSVHRRVMVKTAFLRDGLISISDSAFIRDTYQPDVRAHQAVGCSI